MSKFSRKRLSPRRCAMAFAWTLLFLLLPTPSRAQCQTWSTQFDASNLRGNAIYALQVFDDGTGSKLWVGGDFWGFGGAWVGKWDGEQWSSACCLPDAVYSLAVYDSGQGPEIYAGYGVWSGFGSIVRWTGNGWVIVGGGLGRNDATPSGVIAMAAYDSGSGSELYIGGSFYGSQSLASRGLIRWNGSSWNTVGSGLGAPVGQSVYATDLTVYDDGSGPALYVAGSFTTAGGIASPRIAKWNGTNWSSLGSGVNNEVTGMGVWDDGSGAKLYVSGTFTIAGGVPVSKVAIWDGGSWLAMAVPPIVSSAAILPFDDGRGPALFFSGAAMVDGMQSHQVSRWDGVQWSALGLGIEAPVYCMASYDDGSGHGPDLYIGGQFINVGGYTPSRNIGRWYRCAGPIDSVCPGDKTLAPCPCSNPGLSGHGCQNSANTGGAFLVSSGTTSPDTLHFTSSGELPHSLTILLQGDAPTNWTWAFGDGLRCTGGHLLRLFVTNAIGGVADMPGAGDLSVSARSAAMGNPIAPGSIRLYQAYYRDPASACATGFNVSNGVRVVWPAF